MQDSHTPAPATLVGRGKRKGGVVLKPSGWCALPAPVCGGPLEREDTMPGGGGLLRMELLRREAGGGANLGPSARWRATSPARHL
jgi:hypothetical protein